MLYIILKINSQDRSRRNSFLWSTIHFYVVLKIIYIEMVKLIVNYANKSSIKLNTEETDIIEVSKVNKSIKKILKIYKKDRNNYNSISSNNLIIITTLIMKIIIIIV